MTERTAARDQLTIPDALERGVNRYATHPWMALRDEVRTFERLGADVDAIARGLAALGLGHGERLGLFMDNRFEWLQTEYAATSLGAWLVPLNTWFRFRELEHVLSESGLQVLVWTDPLLGRRTRDQLLELVPELDRARPGAWRSERFPGLRTVVGIGEGPWPEGVLPWAELLRMGAATADADLSAARRRVTPDDIGLLMYTSGTTGRPKGAMIRHRSVVDHIGTWTRHLRLRGDDRSIMSSPLFWSFGCTVNALVPLHCGSMIALQERYDPLAFLQDLVRYDCTHLQGVPSQYEMALKHADAHDYDLSRLRLVQIGGSASAEGLARRILERAPDAQFVSAYGLTEAVGVNTYTDLDDPLEAVMQTVGHAAPDNELTVEVPDGEGDVPAGEVGELCIRGENVMAGYLDNPEATNAALRGGWLRTGDLAVMDEAGYVRIVGRHVDAYKRGGVNVYPAEAEALIGEHPSVHAVAIVGVPDDRLGEVGVAFVLPRDGVVVDQDSIRSFCAGRIASYKVPERVVEIDALPLTPTGKVQKFVLKERYAAG
jgi:acyl-CoA synthetase (AMP-forming)/AMP-acid ligase II